MEISLYLITHTPEKTFSGRTQSDIVAEERVKSWEGKGRLPHTTKSPHDGCEERKPRVRNEQRFLGTPGSSRRTGNKEPDSTRNKEQNHGNSGASRH